MVKTKCSLCNSESVVLYDDRAISSDLNSNDNFNAYKCENCKLIFISPVVSEEEREIKHKNPGVISNIILNIFLSERRRKIESIKKKGKLLDIGCGIGHFLWYMKKHNWDVYGTDVSDETVNLAHKLYGLNVVKTGLNENIFPDVKFDVITFWHVFEHISEPKIILENTKKILASQGFIYICVPNIESWQYILAKKKWCYLDWPRHIYSYSPYSIKKFFELTDFEIIKKYNFSFEYDIYGWVQTFLNLIGIEYNFLYNWLKKDKTLKNLNDYLNAIVSLIGTSVLILPAIILSFLSAVFNKSSVIEVCVTKYK